jgi:hypothetical protein
MTTFISKDRLFTVGDQSFLADNILPSQWTAPVTALPAQLNFTLLNLPFVR